MQWDNGKNAGFTTGEPWFYVNPNYSKINVAQQEGDPDSILNFYRKAIDLRKSLAVVKDGDYREHYGLRPKLFGYSRTLGKQKLLVVCSFSGKAQSFRLPHGFDPRSAKLVLQNYSHPAHNFLQPYETRVYLWN